MLFRTEMRITYSSTVPTLVNIGAVRGKFIGLSVILINIDPQGPILSS